MNLKDLHVYFGEVDPELNRPRGPSYLIVQLDGIKVDSPETKEWARAYIKKPLKLPFTMIVLPVRGYIGYLYFLSLNERLNIWKWFYLEDQCCLSDLRKKKYYGISKEQMTIPHLQRTIFS